MRIRNLIIASTFCFSASLSADQTISQELLDKTLYDAQNAVAAKDFNKAFELYQKAAHWGHNGAQYVLGELYLQGKGTAEDDVTGAAWLDVAAESRNRDFVRARNKALKELTDSEKAAVEELSEKISDAYGIDATGLSCKKESVVGSNIRSVNCYHSTNNGGELIVPEEAGSFYAAS